MAGFGEELQRGLSIAGSISEIGDRKKAAEFDADFNSHYKAMTDNPKYTPNVNNKKFNSKAYHAARMAKFTETQADQTIKENQMRIMDTRIKQQWDIANNGMRKAGVAMSAKNFSGALNEMEKTYEGIIDGSDMVISKDRKGWKVINADGSESQEQRFESEEALANGLSNLAGSMMKDRDTFSGTIWSNYQGIWNHNQNRMSQGEAHVRPDGNVGMKYAGMVDPWTGEKRGVVYEYAGEEMSEKDWKKQQFVAMDVGVKRAQIGAEKAKGVAKAAAPHADVKLASDYEKRFGITPQAAMRKVMRGKMSKEILQIGAKTIADEGYDMDDAEDVKEFKIKMEALGVVAELEVGRGIGKKPKDKAVPKDVQALKSEYLGLVKKHGKEKAKDMLRKKYPSITNL